jgi:hypothetical protein
MIHEQDRKKELERLYHESYGHILDLALADRRLLPQDGENIAHSVARHLESYDGPIEIESFKRWLEDSVNGAVQRIGSFYGLQKECRKNVRAGIWLVLAKNLDLKDHSNTAFLIEQIEANVWAWAWNHLDDLMKPGTAKLSTRMAARAKCETLTWRKSKLRENDRFDDVDVHCFGDQRTFEVSIDEAGRITNGGKLYFDPGQDDNEDDSEQPVHRPKNRPIPSPSDSLLAMKSSKPKLLCPLCKCLQAISSDPPSEADSLKLRCGHERPAALSAVA